MNKMEALKQRLNEYIENINQLGADSVVEDNYDILRTKLESIITWCNMAIVLLNRLDKGGNK